MAVVLSSERHHRMTLAEVYARFLPPLHLNQFVVAEARPAGQDQPAPIGLVLWAELSNEAERRISADPKKATELAASEWKSGPNAWIIDALGPPAVIEAMLKQLVQGPFAGRAVKLRRRNGDGSFLVETLDVSKIAAKV